MVYFYSYYYSHQNKFVMKKSVLFIVTEQREYNSIVLILHYYPVMCINNDPKRAQALWFMNVTDQ